jgi:succinate dehydrogenase/fumarate reductase flavoprotein subunit
MAMALRCGAALQDMEFPMFLPYCFITPPALSGETFSYDFSAMLDVHALNRHGERYMAQWDSKHMEHSTRDVNAVAAAVEIKAGRGSKSGGTYLSFAHLPRNLVQFSSEWFPTNRRNWQADGFNLRDFFSETNTDSWEVAPACHFWNGGVRIDEKCATQIPGLFAAGEGTAGIHGANRLSGNGLTMTQVWGQRAGFYACEFLHTAEYREPVSSQVEEIVQKVESLQQSGSGPSVIEFRNEIRRIASQLVGIVREQSRLEQALISIDTLRKELPEQRVKSQDTRFNREWVEALQNENQLDVLEAIVRSSLARRESRGALYRSDFPETDDENGLYNLVLGRKSNSWTLEKKPVIGDYVSLPHGKRKYGQKGDFNSG